MVSVTSQYAFRALCHLALHEREGAVLGRELAAETGIPPSYLPKIMQALRRAGMVQATRGQGGGYRLRRRPESVRLSEVVALFDGVRAHEAAGAGPEHDPFAAHQGWREVLEAGRHFLESTSLAELAEATRDAGEQRSCYVE